MKTPTHVVTARVVALILLASIPLRVSAADETNVIQPDRFIKQWTILGPIPAFINDTSRTADAAKRDSFDADLLTEAGGEASADPSVDEEVKIRGKSLKWTSVSSKSNEIDLQKAVGEHEWSIAYASANVHAEEATAGMLGLGSDDAVRVWLNGELVHDNWAGRSLRQDSDLVPLKLRQGANQLLLKVLNRKFDWGFTCRLLSDTQLERKFVAAGLTGNLDRVKLLLANGVDVDATNIVGMTAYQAASVRGYAAVAKWLAENGADTERAFADPEDYVDEILKEESRSDQPGVAVLVSRGGKVRFSKGYGLADTTDKIPIAPDTKFRIGSVTKQFTAAAILKLQEDGKLKVSDKLTKFIPDYPRGDEVTLHHLLTHTSGITSYTSKPEFYQDVTKPIEPEDLIASFKDDDFDFAPGEKWSYCNSGYFLLGHIVAEVSGKSYGEYLRETFEPLGMKDSGVHRPDLGLANEASGYSYVEDSFEDALNWHMSRAGAAGAIYSTVEDLQQWNEGVFGGKVLKPQSLAAAFTKAETKANDNAAGYGYGWMMGEQRGLPIIHHSGGLHGFSSYLTRFPKQDLTIAVLHNAALPSSGELEPAGLAAMIAEVFLWKDMAPRPSWEVDESVDPKSYVALVGDYDYGAATMKVTNEDNRLFAQLTGQAKMEIFPANPTTFFWKVVDAQVEFLRDVDDNVVAVQHTQNGQSFKAAKLKEEKAVKVEKETLDRYVGTYDFGAIGKLIVTRKGDHLAAKLASQPAFDVYAKSETKFFYKIIRAELEFVDGDDGHVEKVILRQGPAKLDGKKTD